MIRTITATRYLTPLREGGSLPVAGGARVAADIGALLRSWVARGPDAPAYSEVIPTVVVPPAGARFDTVMQRGGRASGTLVDDGGRRRSAHRLDAPSRAPWR